MKHHSLSRRLLVGLALVSLVYWLIIASLKVEDDIEQVHELYDVHLVHTALALLRLMDPDDHQPMPVPTHLTRATVDTLFENWPDLPDRRASRRGVTPGVASALERPQALFGSKTARSKNVAYAKNLRYQVWRNDGHLMFRSDNAPDTTATELTGFSDTQDPQGQSWHHYSIWDSHHDVRIIVSESHDLRRQMVYGIALSSVIPFALGLPVLLLLLWLSIKRGLLPLVELSREIALRTPQTLLEFNEKNAPREVRPIIAALNDLMRRITQTLDNERRFTANAAHELRTPLAAIQAHLFIARQAANATEQQRAMTQLQHAVNRGIRLVSQLLTMARLDPAQSLPDATAVDVEAVAQAVCAELAPLALQRDQTLELLLAPGLPSLVGNADMLAMLLCNLLDNAIRYTQRGGHISITANACATGLQVAVHDNGPGIAAAERVQVFERFYRIARDEVGSGLGLSICKRIAELHHATMTLEDGLQNCGLTVRVNFSA